MKVKEKEKEMQHYINHISLVVDRSGSMSSHQAQVVKVFDSQLERLKQRSVDLDQETRISIYLFDDKIECLTFDMDVMRFKSLAGHYYTRNQTALIDATLKSIEDNQRLPELYGDHAFLQYVLTDGQENASKHTSSQLSTTLKALPENWTVACLVPNAIGVMEAKKFGFHADSISQWDTSSDHGIERVGRQFEAAIDSYFALRATGIRGTKGLFTLDTSTLSTVAKNTTILQPVAASEYEIIPVHKDSAIKEWVEYWTKQPYRLGSSYYMPTKPVKIQDYKQILVQNKKNGRVYEGHNIRQLLGLPANTVEVNPATYGEWNIFVQSTSVNRKLFAGTFLLIRN